MVRNVPGYEVININSQRQQQTAADKMESPTTVEGTVGVWDSRRGRGECEVSEVTLRRLRIQVPREFCRYPRVVGGVALAS